MNQIIAGIELGQKTAVGVLAMAAILGVPWLIFWLGDKACKTDYAKDRWLTVFQIIIGISVLILAAKGCDGGFHPYIPPDP